MKKWVEREKRLINKQFEKMKKNVNEYNIDNIHLPILLYKFR